MHRERQTESTTRFFLRSKEQKFVVVYFTVPVGELEMDVLSKRETQCYICLQRFNRYHL